MPGEPEHGSPWRCLYPVGTTLKGAIGPGARPEAISGFAFFRLLELFSLLVPPCVGTEPNPSAAATGFRGSEADASVPPRVTEGSPLLGFTPPLCLDGAPACLRGSPTNQPGNGT
jgi:hypothetical protein